MVYILYLLVLVISVTLSFLTKGIEHIVDSAQFNVPMIYYLIGYSVITTLYFKFRFRNKGMFQYWLLRQMVSVNKVFNFIERKKIIFSTKEPLSNLETSSIKLWNSLLKDKSTVLTASITPSMRIINRGNMICCLKSDQDSKLTIIDNTSLNLFYEVTMTQSSAKELYEAFDKEQNIRIEKVLNDRKEFIASVLK